MDPMEWLLKNRYGSLELSRQAGSNLLRGFAGSVFLHTLMITALFAIAMVNSGDHTKIGQIPGGTIYIMPHLPPMPTPPVVPELSKPSVPNPASKPVAVPTELPLGEEPKPTTGPIRVPGPVAAPGTGTGTTLPDISQAPGLFEDPIPRRDIFIPFEVAPAALDINLQPAYPEIALIAKTEGKVVVSMYVDQHGDVKKWEVLKANPKGLGFEEAVLSVIPKWKFTPAIQEHNPVGVWITIPFTFSIK